MHSHFAFNPADPFGWIPRLWASWLVVWLLAAVTAKRTRTQEPTGTRLLYLIPVLLAAMLVFSPIFRAGVLVERFLPRNLAIEWAGAALTALGIAFTFWARVHLGRNWSGRVVIKELHELIRSGPYSSVRHPIYTGLLLALIGTALTIGEVRILVAIALAGFHFYTKAKREEGFMSLEFGEQYANYRQQTGMLIPKVTRST